jgi:hypothetical protein
MVQLHSVHYLPRKLEEIIYEFYVKSHQSATADIFCFTKSYAWVPSQNVNKSDFSHHPAIP